jgi:hypothetical protein
VGEATLVHLGVAVVPYGVVVAVVETSYGTGQVETWEVGEVHIVLAALPQRHVSVLVDTWRVPAFVAVIHAKDCSARQKATVDGGQRWRLVVVERVGDNSCIGGLMR